MTPDALRGTLDTIVGHALDMSVMIWGAPGIGKSSVVARVAANHGLELVDVRLSQLAPTDLRGLPVPDAERRTATWYPPEFLPREGRGVLFFDELNMAPPAVQGIAQQLVLDRRVGSYVVPDGWFVWAAGNRKEDRASVFQMPAPLANRFLHVEVEADLDSFRRYAIERELHEQIVAFLSYRPNLLHALDPQRAAWPSPRTWEMASRLHAVGLDVAPAVGEAAAAELQAFVDLYRELVDPDVILAGRGTDLTFPDKPSVRYALTLALALRADDIEPALAAFRWMLERASAEWMQLFVSQLVARFRARGRVAQLAACIRDEPRLRDFVADFGAMLRGTA